SRLRKALLPLAAWGAAWAGAQAMHDRAVTGHPLRLPYLEYSRQYSSTPPLWILPAGDGPRRLPTATLRRIHDWELTWLNQPERPFPIALWKRFDFVLSTLRTDCSADAPLILLLLFAAGVEAAALSLAVPIALGLFALSLETWTLAHYAAPVAALLWVALFVALSRLARWRRRGARAGAVLVLGVLVCLLVKPVLTSAARIAGWNRQAQPRSAIARLLAAQPGGHLVLVRRAPEASLHEEWVYNGPDIDAQRIVWAHDLGSAANDRLLTYYRGRRIWVLEPEKKETGAPRLTAIQRSGPVNRSE
ncbi:MAG TPA: hypothetical protein DEH78_11350, partial [Solibacterales bacterium]|nr:hypothetical protein [Bryobacterales bacterium]